MKKLLIVCLSILILSCKTEPKESFQNGNFKIDLLFEQDGCRVYRFMDGGRFIYWSNCEGRLQFDYYTRSRKNRVTHYQETITTK